MLHMDIGQDFNQSFNWFLSYLQYIKLVHCSFLFLLCTLLYFTDSTDAKGSLGNLVILEPLTI